jgi:CheY-like chemotaxis protein
MVATRILRKLGYQADVVTSGREVVATAEAGDYAALILDCELPELDGFAAAREIRRRESEAARAVRRLPIIALTANAMAGDRERCLAAGMDEYLTKPMRLDEVSVLLRRWAPLGQ